MAELHLNGSPVMTGFATPSQTPVDIGVSNLRQALLRRKASTSGGGSSGAQPATTRQSKERAAHSSKETEQDSHWPNQSVSVLFKMLWWCIYTCFFTFFIFVGEILPALREGVLRAFRAFLNAPVPSTMEPHKM